MGGTDQNEGGTRAAVYKGDMGSRQRKASRMHEEASPAAAGSKAGGRLSGIKAAAAAGIDKIVSGKRGRLFYGAAGLCVCVLLSGLFLYPAAQDYYTALRDNAKSQAEYEALVEYYEDLEDEIAYMQTDEGVEDAVRAKYGWVSDDENSLMVQGVQSESDFDGTDVGILPSGSVSAPDTWYSSVLDPFFGYES